jgi:hypothetical protein
MPGDPKECRFHALSCAEFAASAETQQSNAMFLNLSKKWEKLAVELERAQAIIKGTWQEAGFLTGF